MNKNNKPAVNDSVKYTQNTEAQTFTKAYALSLSKVLKQGRRIRAMNSPNEWSDAELEILRTYYPTEGYKRCQEEGIQKTISMITAKATSMGLKRITGDSQDNETSERYIGNHINSDDEWTHKEINILKKHFPHGGCEACKENGLDEKSDLEILVKINKVMPERKAEFIKKGFMTPVNWTKNDVKILLENYEAGGSSLCQEKGLNKKSSAIRMMARSLDLSMVRKKDKKWTTKDDKLLIKTYQENTRKREACYELFLDRTKTDINNRLKELGLTLKKRWSDEEVAILKEYFPKGGARLAIQNGIDRDMREISAKASTLGIKVQKQRVIWSDEEIEILKEYYPIEGTKVLDRLGDDKNAIAVRNKAKYLGIQTPISRWTDEEVEILKKYYPTEGQYIQDRLPNKSLATIRSKATALQIYKTKKKSTKKK